MRFEELIEQPCSITRPLTVLGDRWTFLIVKQAFAGVRRFEDFHASLGISRSRLADRLDRLVEHDILRREPYKDDRRTRMLYRLTDKGHDLYPILLAIRQWGDEHMAPEGPPVHYRHRDCGGEARVHARCDACDRELTAREVVAEPGPGAAPPGDGR